MSAQHFDPTREQLAAVFEYAGLDIEPERLEDKFEVYRTTLGLIRKASVTGIGETVPASAFKASWT
ncbi:hypothetical protein HQO44_19950 [Rhodococcus fascians]|uniref:hypothetical protein n=1 Tax=Rhodococcus sp. 06-1474-1B TaxID=2022499 RepID=UPI000B9B0737|nr:hypothetical protein [Rhodococcus sp. 06-1474-1B]MBY4208729.1 hypothetical protein [Rhodococcus fascians]OZD46928.1 hypothetical protein CH266_19010 [Rhodococcus sp. 06-1474-1B]OZD52434.1 hypothetical protein CH252_13495 [Rhodococcus sp. 06-1477-1B]